jgi:hypothetical protein
LRMGGADSETCREEARGVVYTRTVYRFVRQILVLRVVKCRRRLAKTRLSRGVGCREPVPSCCKPITRGWLAVLRRQESNCQQSKAHLRAAGIVQLGSDC